MAMDDRKSAVSSFYGGRKNSFDALNEYPPGSSSPKPVRGDDASSFYNPRSSGDMLNQNYPKQSAGYNRNSFFHVGREEPLKGGRDEEEAADMLRGDEGWDIYADFNNAGPRYSNAFGGKGDGYQPIGTPTRAEAEESGSVKDSAAHKTEMVTVPVMGAEWTKRELRGMTKAGKAEQKSEARRDKLKAFARGERNCCGIPWLNRKVVVIVLFILIIIVAVAVGICFPRVPSFGIDSKTPLKSASGTDFGNTIQTIFSRAPDTNFSFPAYANLQLNTQDNYLPLTFKSLKAEVIDLNTERKVATGDLGHYKVPAKSFPTLSLPLNFTYSASNDTDQTWADYYNGCRNKLSSTDGTRPGLKFRITLIMSIMGYPGTPRTSAEITNAACPIELPTSAG